MPTIMFFFKGPKGRKTTVSTIREKGDIQTDKNRQEIERNRLQ